MSIIVIMMLTTIKKVFRRLEEERLSQLQAMAALYLQVIEFVIMITIITIILIKINIITR